MARGAIIFTLFAGILFTWVNVYVKFENPDFPLTHWFNAVTYYIKNGFVFLILAAILVGTASKRLVLWTLIGSVPLTVLLANLVPALNYFNRSSVVILFAFALVATPTVIKKGWSLSWKNLLQSSDPRISKIGWILLGSLILCHIVFH